jgi:hypothetical protein
MLKKTLKSVFRFCVALWISTSPTSCQLYTSSCLPHTLLRMMAS